MNQHCKVDVVIPLYNKRPYVRAALSSVLHQTLSPQSVIIVDDGSTDGSLEHIDDVDDRRLTVVRQSNQGPGAARNNGFRLGQSAYVAFLDADDEWEPTFLERCVRILEAHPTCALCNSSWVIEPTGESAVDLHRKRGITDGFWRCPPNIAAAELKSAVDFCHSSAVVVRREVLARMGGYFERDRCTFGEDSYLFFRILLSFPVYRLLEPLIRFHSEASVLGAGRPDAHPVPPLLTYADNVAADCPPAYCDLLRRYLAFYALFVGSRMAREGQPWDGLLFLLRRVALSNLERTYWPKYARQVGKALFLVIGQCSGRSAH